ncbi:hypothetical protein [Actinacidiphila yeochonensis]|uniref:hypothetical protein n=1 Tax=Actinacidiphila yeochonensis TaxID=89050 RepID=UPI00055A1ED1|nr:hypothetical protein [Actinacidiphila yeochonensis]
MLWNAVGFAVLGLLAAAAAGRLLPRRLPLSPLTLFTGVAAALTGGLIARTIVGRHHPEATFPAAVLTAVVLLSLLAGPPKHGRHTKTPAASA